MPTFGQNPFMGYIGTFFGGTLGLYIYYQFIVMVKIAFHIQLGDCACTFEECNDKILCLKHYGDSNMTLQNMYFTRKCLIEYY